MSPKIGRLVPPDVVVVVVEGPELPQHLHHVVLGIYEDSVEKKKEERGIEDGKERGEEKDGGREGEGKGEG